MFSSNTTQVSDGGYQISRSLRFNSADSAYLNRTPASAGNRKTWTWSGWVKRSLLSSGFQMLFDAGSSYTEFTNFAFYISSDDKLVTTTGAFEIWRTTQLFRDPSAWYHMVLVVDTTQATADNRTRLYINGTEVTSFTRSTNLSLNTDYGINYNIVHYIGQDFFQTVKFGGYMTEVNFIDGQALTPSSFGETNAQTGVWQPKAYSGSYGTNGFYLNFSDNSNITAATLGADYSGNGNNWTPNNFSVSAGVGNDSLVDVPTLYGIDTGVGGTVRGNYCTFSPLDKATTVGVSNGNLDVIGLNGGGRARASMAVSSGKWYFEFLMVDTSGGGYNGFMATTARADVTGGGGTTDLGQNVDTWGIPNGFTGASRNNGTNGSTITGITNGQIGMYALDMDTGKFWYGINGTWVNSGDPAAGANPVYSNLSGYTVAAGIGHGTGTTISYSYNFGQRAFAYTAPSGFQALCTQNLPTPTIGATTATQAGKFFNTSLYTGTGSNLAITGVGFQPDWLWIKHRSGTDPHTVLDVLRGVDIGLTTNTTAAEVDFAVPVQLSFDSDGFTLGTNGRVNTSAQTYVGWNWKANGSGSSNTAGSITSTVSANTTSGFSVVTYTGNGIAGATRGHGLGVAPNMILIKGRTNVDSWHVYHSSLGNTSGLLLNSDSGFIVSPYFWNDTSPSSTVFTTNLGTSNNANGVNYVAYCFAAVAGYSAFGSYTGNGSADGPFVFTGFRPAYVMIKLTSSGSYWWMIKDATRDPYNTTSHELYANVADAEYTGSGYALDFLSNGFKIKSTGTAYNGSGSTYIYMAFAETPFKYSLAR